MKQKTILIKNANIVNEGAIVRGDILIEGEFIKEINDSISAKSSDVYVKNRRPFQKYNHTF